jgi:hypothetical protein
VDIKSTAERYPTGGSERASNRQLQNQNWIWILKHVDIADDVFLKWSIHVRLHKNNTNIEGERRLEDGDRAIIQAEARVGRPLLKPTSCNYLGLYSANPE